jgi:hypothetical protein
MIKTLKLLISASVLIVIGSGLTIAFVYQDSYPPTAPQSVRIVAFAPPRAEVYYEDEVKSARPDGPFEVEISIVKLEELAVRSNYNPLVSHGVGGSSSESIVYNYWLSRGDGAWYHAESSLKPPVFGLWFRNQWQRQDDFTWIAQPVYEHWLSRVIVGVGALAAIFGFYLLLWLCRPWRWLKRHPDST